MLQHRCRGGDTLQPCGRGLSPATRVTSAARLFWLGPDSEREHVPCETQRGQLTRRLPRRHVSRQSQLTAGSRSPPEGQKKERGKKKRRKKNIPAYNVHGKTVTLERRRGGNRPLCTPTFHFCVSDDPLKLWRDGRKLFQMWENFHHQ